MGHRPDISSPFPAACRPKQESCRGHRRARLIAPRGSAGPACPAGGVAMTAAFLGRESLDFLVARLSWPVPFVRWRAARALRDLVDAPATRTEATDQLLRCLASARCESEVCTILTVFLMARPVARPASKVLATTLRHPSILAKVLLLHLGVTGDLAGDDRQSGE